MTVDAIILISIGAAFGGLVNGLAGLAPDYLHSAGGYMFCPHVSRCPCCDLTLVSGVQGVFAVRQALNWPRLARFVIPALLGLPLGFAMLAYINASTLKLLVGVMLALFGGFFIARPSFKRWQKDHKLADSAVGFIGGVLGALAGLSGALPTIWSAFMTGKRANNALYCSPSTF